MPDDHSVDPPDDFDDKDELQAWVMDITDAVNHILEEQTHLLEEQAHLADEQDRTDTNVKGIYGKLSKLSDTHAEFENRLEAVDQTVEDVGEHVEVVDATMPDQTKNKIERVQSIVDYAFTHASGGLAGVTVKTGEATAASGASRTTALKLMDEIGGSFEWADVENPGGPKPKRLKLSIREREKTDLMEEVHEQYS